MEVPVFKIRELEDCIFGGTISFGWVTLLILLRHPKGCQVGQWAWESGFLGETGARNKNLFVVQKHRERIWCHEQKWDCP